MEGILGIDIGGTGIKAAIVNPKTGELLSERIKVKTPKPSTPEAVLQVIKDFKKKLKFTGTDIGIGYPGIVKNGKTLTAANIDKSWIDYSIVEKFSKGLRSNVYVINDADAAGLAEMKFGGGKRKKGLVVFLTIGTGIGSAPFKDGKILANTEFGHLKYKNAHAEKYASNAARELKKMSWKAWGNELNEYLKMIHFYFSPDEFIIGGGVSKEFEQFQSYLTVPVPVSPAKLLNAAGVIGAAMAASDKLKI
jgi:polyphosphate glucokinase